MGTHPATLQHC